jgi:predicted phosphodiesterase
MKIVIASDIHGSAYWCARLMDRIDAIAPDRIVLLGDLLYHGPRNDLPRDYAPKRVIPMLNGIASSIVAVRGNCEAEVDQMVLDFPCMADYVMVEDEATSMFCTHGHLWNPQHMPPLFAGDIAGADGGADSDVVDVASDATDNVASGVGSDSAHRPRSVKRAFLYGHTHIKQYECVNGVQLINPGSVSIPKDGSHSFATYEDGAFTLHTLAEK